MGRRGWLCLALTIAAGAWIAWHTFHGWTSARLDRLVRAELPPGSTRAEVEAFLDRHGIPHAYAGGAGQDSFYAQKAKEAGLDVRCLAGVVQGEIGGGAANEHLLFYSEVSAYFFLDEQGRLAGHLVDGMIYGP